MYEITTAEIFKGEPDVEYAVNMSFDLVMDMDSGMCGISLEIGEEYLIDLNGHALNGQDTFQAVGSCGLVELWSFVSEENQALLRGGCADYDPCEERCDVLQVFIACHIRFERSSSSLPKPTFYRVYSSPWVANTSQARTNNASCQKGKKSTTHAHYLYIHSSCFAPA